MQRTDSELPVQSFNSDRLKIDIVDKLTKQERIDILNKHPALAARLFDAKMTNFWKYILMGLAIKLNHTHQRYDIKKHNHPKGDAVRVSATFLVWLIRR